MKEGGRLFEAGRLLTFSAFRTGAYSSWALIRINTVGLQDSCYKNWYRVMSVANNMNVFFGLVSAPVTN